jgi:hypothetical protein
LARLHIGDHVVDLGGERQFAARNELVRVGEIGLERVLASPLPACASPGDRALIDVSSPSAGSDWLSPMTFLSTLGITMTQTAARTQAPP